MLAVHKGFFGEVMSALLTDMADVSSCTPVVWYETDS